jgi:hypothetical protein
MSSIVHILRSQARERAELKSRHDLHLALSICANDMTVAKQMAASGLSRGAVIRLRRIWRSYDATRI